MKRLFCLSPPRLWLVLALAVGLTAFLGIYVLEGSANTPAGRLFDSYLAPTPPPATANPTATPALATRPPATPPAAAPPKTTLTTHTIRLPLMLKQYPWQLAYGWKGVGDPGQLDAHPSDGFWGIYPDWWYNWGGEGSYTAKSGSRTMAETLADLEAGLQDPRYAPMIWCPHDVKSDQPTPEEAANLARRYPGRVWLMFNEPDNTAYQCGYWINQDPRYHPFFQYSNWEGLGEYLAQQYILYYDAIKAADPYSRLFAVGLLALPMPTLSNPWWRDGVPVWNAFVTELADQGHTLDGIAIHAYPNSGSSFHQNCLTGPAGYLDYGCVQRALGDAHGFFQTQSGTAAKTIWITEIGSLTSVDQQPWTTTRDGFENPLLSWFSQHIRPGQDRQYVNAVSWFSTHYKTATEDFTASNLLNHLQPELKQLTAVGQAWRDRTCPDCACPGPDCP